MTSSKARKAARCDAALISGVAIFGIGILAQMHFDFSQPNNDVVVVFPPWTRGTCN